MTTGRAAYYLLLIALLMPSLPDGKPSSTIGPQARTAVRERTLGQTAHTGYAFCSQQRHICEATSYLLQKFEAKAKYPIHVLTNWTTATTVRNFEHRALSPTMTQ